MHLLRRQDDDFFEMLVIFHGRRARLENTRRSRSMFKEKQFFFVVCNKKLKRKEYGVFTLLSLRGTSSFSSTGSSASCGV